MTGAAGVSDWPAGQEPWSQLQRLLLGSTDRSWVEQAACRGSAVGWFFPRDAERVNAQRAVCARCPVREECLDYALATNEKYGVWGGMSVKERKSLRRKHQRAALKARNVA